MLWRPFFARVKVNHRRVYSRILAKVCAVAMATGLVKTRPLQKWFLFILKNPVVGIFSSFAHYELTLNFFCQHCSNKILTGDFSTSP